MGFHLAAHMLANNVVDFLVGIKLVRPYVYQHRASVGYDVVLRARIDHGESHLDRSEELAYLGERKVSNPSHVVQGLIDGVHPLVSRGMAALAVGNEV